MIQSQIFRSGNLSEQLKFRRRLALLALVLWLWDFPKNRKLTYENKISLKLWNSRIKFPRGTKESSALFQRFNLNSWRGRISRVLYVTWKIYDFEVCAFPDEKYFLVPNQGWPCSYLTSCLASNPRRRISHIAIKRLHGGELSESRTRPKIVHQIHRRNLMSYIKVEISKK